MINTQKDTHLLFYNVFGICWISANTIRISLNIYKDGRIQGRTLEKELDTPMLLIDKPVIMPFGAWVQENEIYHTPGRLDGYDAEVYEANKAVIEETIKSALSTIKGAVA